MSLQSRKAAVSLFCRPALTCRECILPTTGAAVHWIWVTAALYKQQTFTGVIAVSQGCCQPDFHSSIDQWRMLSANNSCCSALNWSLHLCMSRKYSQVSLRCRKAAVSLFCRPALTSRECLLPTTGAAVHWIWVAAALYEQQILHRCHCSVARLLSV